MLIVALADSTIIAIFFLVWLVVSVLALVFLPRLFKRTVALPPETDLTIIKQSAQNIIDAVEDEVPSVECDALLTATRNFLELVGELERQLRIAQDKTLDLEIRRSAVCNTQQLLIDANNAFRIMEEMDEFRKAAKLEPKTTENDSGDVDKSSNQQ